MPKRTKVMILRGLPGAGKDTFLKSLAVADGLKIATCSADDYFMKSGTYKFNVAELTAAHDECFGRFVNLCGGMYYEDNDLDYIAVSNTNSQLFEMSPYIMYARYSKLEIEIVEIKCPNSDAGDHAVMNIHRVPEPSIQGMMDRWEGVPPFWSQPRLVDSVIGHFQIWDEDGVNRRRIPAHTGNVGYTAR